MSATAAEIRKEYPHTKEGNARWRRDNRRGRGLVARMTVEQVARRDATAFGKKEAARNRNKNGPVKTYFDPSIIRKDS